MDTKVIEGTKEEARLLKWLQKAQSKDISRPALTGLHVNENHAVTCDSLRVHIIDKPDCLQEIENETITLKVPTGGAFLARAEVMEDANYPDYQAVMPITQEFTIAVNPKFLIDALSNMGSTCVLRFTDKYSPMEVVGKDKEKNTLYSIIMPMRHDEESGIAVYRPALSTDDVQENEDSTVKDS